MIGTFMIGSEPRVVDLLVTDFGSAEIPAHMSAVIRAVPRRADGKTDRRFKSGRWLLEWEDQMNKLAAKRYEMGIEPAAVVEPFTP